MINKTEYELLKAVEKSSSKAEVLTNLGYPPDRKLYPSLDKLANKYHIILPSSRKGYANSIRAIPEEELISLSNTVSTKKQILFHYNLPDTAHNYKVLSARLKDLNIDKFNINTTGIDNKQYKKAVEYLTTNSSIRSSTLKDKLILEEILENKCNLCGQLPYWNNKPLVLQLDHINGINTDNRLENIRLLCPNCHTQTDNYVSKNIKG